ncbi:transmembrane domain-containing protein [Cryptosporidium canis]|uniref:Transmembrane domain-containing protein n=1 Tax=Cryptosporidium canis TaxID=195482 RepID=A0ABQ8P1N9_9CRYT|nr:transmembrane domain-containing protein [Cryptosporidium canis]
MFLSKQYNAVIRNELGDHLQTNVKFTNKVFSKTILLFINSIFQLLIIDVIFIIFNRYVNKYASFSLTKIFMLVINFALTHLSLQTTQKLHIYSTEFALNLEKKIEFGVLENGCSDINSLNIESQCLDLFLLIRNGIISIIHLLFYPVRLGFLGYIFFNNNWEVSLFVGKAIGLLLVAAIFEYLRIKLFILPKQISDILKINEYLDNIKPLLLLGAHRDKLTNTSKTTTLINFLNSLLNYIFLGLHTIFIIYTISIVQNCFQENSHDHELLRMDIFNCGIAVYLLYSIKYAYHGISLIVHLNDLRYLFQISRNQALNGNFSSEIISNYNNIYDEVPIDIPISENVFKKTNSNELEIANSYGIPHEKYPLITSTCNRKLGNYSNNSENILEINFQLNLRAHSCNTISGYKDDSKHILLSNDLSNHRNKNGNILFWPISKIKERINFKCSRGCFNYFGLFEWLRQNYSNDFKENQMKKMINSEIIESYFYIKNINLSIRINESIIIFGSNYISKQLLTKLISGFPNVHGNEQFCINLTGFINCGVYLFNRNMLRFVSDFYEFRKKECTIDPFDFVLSGCLFNPEIFELIYDSLLSDYFVKYETSQDIGETNKYYIYPKVENNQEFLEAKIFLQLSQFFYNILISIGDKSPVIVIIDGIFELLLPSTYLKFAEKILSNHSVFSDFNISFIITTENDLLPYLSSLFKNSSHIKLAILNENGLELTKNHLNEQANQQFFQNLPPIDRTINEIFVKSNNTFSSKSLYSISELYFKRLCFGNLYSKKFLIFTYIIGLVTFWLKVMIFRNMYISKVPSNELSNSYSYFIFEIVSFGPLISLETSPNFHSIEICSLLVGYISISSFLMGSYNKPFSETNLFNKESTQKIDQKIHLYKKELPNLLNIKNKQSFKHTRFIEFNGRQLLKTTSSFYRDHFLNSQVISIPGASPNGFKSAIISSKLIQDKLSRISKDSDYEIPSKPKYLSKKTHKLKFTFNKDFVIIVIGFLIINVTSKILVCISIFGFRPIHYLNFRDFYFQEFTSTVLSSDDPISVINDIELRRGKYFSYFFEEISHLQNKVSAQYLTIIFSLGLLFFFAVSNHLHLDSVFGILFNSKLYIVTLFFPILYFIVKLFDIKKSEVDFTSMDYNSTDIFYYLSKIKSFSWLRNQVCNLFKIRLQRSNKLIHSEFISLLNSLIISITCTIFYFFLNYKNNEGSKQFIVDLFIFLPLIYFLIRSINAHATKTPTNIPSADFHYVKWLKGFFYKTIYLPIHKNISTYSGSPKTNRSLSPDIKGSTQTEDGYELSTPISKSSHNIDPIFSMNSISIHSSPDLTFDLVNPLLIMDNSLSFGSASSPLFPIRQLRMIQTDAIERVAVVSNYNLVSSYWSISMVLDPKCVYKNCEVTLLNTLESLNLFPKALRNFDPKWILSLSVQEYSDLINNLDDRGKVISDMSFTNDGIEFNIFYPGELIGCNRETKKRILDTVYIKKLLLLGHFILYDVYYRKLILHLDYNMDLNVWICLARKLFDDKKSSIDNIIFISSGTI